MILRSRNRREAARPRRESTSFPWVLLPESSLPVTFPPTHPPTHTISTRNEANPSHSQEPSKYLALHLQDTRTQKYLGPTIPVPDTSRHSCCVGCTANPRRGWPSTVSHRTLISFGHCLVLEQNDQTLGLIYPYSIHSTSRRTCIRGHTT